MPVSKPSTKHSSAFSELGTSDPYNYFAMTTTRSSTLNPRPRRTVIVSTALRNTTANSSGVNESHTSAGTITVAARWEAITSLTTRRASSTARARSLR